MSCLFLLGYYQFKISESICRIVNIHVNFIFFYILNVIIYDLKLC
jgi:hypothetical protein